MKYIFLTILLTSLLACGGDQNKKSFQPESSKPQKASMAKEKKDTESSSKSEQISSEKQEASMSPEQIKKGKELLKNVDKKELAAVDTKKLFKMHCALCHGFNGKMMVNGAKDLSKSKIPMEESIAQVYFGKGLMTPYKGVLSDVEIVALSQYVEKELRD